MLMTKEEAVEEILLGPYRTCTHCSGRGWLLEKKGERGSIISEPSFSQDQNVFNLPKCQSCKGAGKWLRGDYRSACGILGLVCPSPASSSKQDSSSTVPMTVDCSSLTLHVHDEMSVEAIVVASIETTVLDTSIKVNIKI